MPVPSGATFLGVARELTRGTYRAPTDFLPIGDNANSPNDLPHTASDTNMRGSAVESYDEIATQIWAEPDFSGNVYADGIGFWLKSLLGDETGTGTAGTATTLSANTVAGALTILVVADPGPIGTVVRVGTAGTGEVRTISGKSGSGPYTLAFTVPLDRTYLSGAAVTVVTAPFIRKFAVLNSGNFQPESLSLTDYNGDVARGIPGAMCSSCGLKWTATGLLTWDAKFTGFQSAAQSVPTRSYGTERAKPGYQSITTLGGTPITNNSDGEVTMTRNVDVAPACDGTQDPYAIWAGNVGVKGKINLVYESAVFASEYPKLLASTATTLDLNWTNSAAGAALRALELQMSNVLYTTGKPTRGKSYVELPLDFNADANTTDAGPSGGYSPVLAILTNARGNAY